MLFRSGTTPQSPRLRIEETVLEKGKWHHLALVKTGLLGSDEWKLYINGNGKLKTTSLPTNPSSHNWIIGANNSNTKASPVYNSFFNGYIDEFRIVSSKVYNSNFAPKNHQFFPTQIVFSEVYCTVTTVFK